MQISAFNVTGDRSLDDHVRRSSAWSPQVGHELRFLTNVKDEYIREISWEATESDAITPFVGISSEPSTSRDAVTFHFRPGREGTMLIRCRVLTVWNSTVLGAERKFIVVPAQSTQHLEITNNNNALLRRIDNTTPSVDLDVEAANVPSENLRGTHARHYGKHKVSTITVDSRYPPLSSTLFLMPDPAEIEIRAVATTTAPLLKFSRTLTLDGLSEFMLPSGSKIFWTVKLVGRHGVKDSQLLDWLFRRRQKTTSEKTLSFLFPDPGIYHIKAVIQIPECAPIKVKARFLLFATQPDIVEQRR